MTATPAYALPRDAESLTATHHPYKVLIADDDKELLALLGLVLRKEGYEVMEATDAYRALRLALEGRPDVLLLDIHMPAGEGFSVQERLKTLDGSTPAGGRATRRLPVIYVSGDRSEQVDALAASLGAFAVLRKPFTRRDIVETVRSALEGGRAAA